MGNGKVASWFHQLLFLKTLHPHVSLMASAKSILAAATTEEEPLPQPKKKKILEKFLF